MESLCYSANKESEDAYDVSTSLTVSAFSKNCHSRQPEKCASARALGPIRAESSSNGSCEDGSALQPSIKSWSELQRSKPTRCNVSEVKRLQKRHLYIGRSASHLGCKRSFWANPFQVKRYGQSGGISKFEAFFNSSPARQRRLGQLTDKVLLCHCSQSESCHGDVLIRAWEDKFLNSEEQDADEEAAQAEELFRAAEQRQPLEEPESQSEDESQDKYHEEQVGERWESHCVWVEVHTKERCMTAPGYAP